jgi:hypothetical protein
MCCLCPAGVDRTTRTINPPLQSQIVVDLVSDDEE